MTARWLASILALVAAGCAPETGLEIEIRQVGVEPGIAIDALNVDLVASQDAPTTPHGSPNVFTYTCRPVTWGVLDLHFPLTIVVHPGEIDWGCVGVRATGFLDGNLAIRAEQIFCADLANGVHHGTLELTSGCLLASPGDDCDGDHVCTCPAGAFCDPDDRCRNESTVTAMFDAAPAVSSFCNAAVEEESDE
jgi:hypothetical protein